MESIEQAPGQVIPVRKGYTITRRKRYWEVLDPQGCLVCLTVYKRGADEVVRRLDARGPTGSQGNGNG